MEIQLDKNIIKKFNVYISENTDILYEIYRDKNGKNNWGCICASMDWIKVTVNQIEHLKAQEENPNIDLYFMELFSFISATDTIVESITQLSRIIEGKNRVIYNGKKDIFTKSSPHEDCDDNSYFKEIRSIFGAHPVNLKKGKGENEKKWFASWPHKNHNKKNHVFVRLYSRVPEEKDIKFEVNIEELNKYLISRYNYLNNLIGKLEVQKQNRIKKMKKIKIEESDDVIKQLNILKEESEKRENNQYYNEVIEKLLRFFENIKVEKNDKNYLTLRRYSKELKRVIVELKEKLQEMEFVDLETDYIVSPKVNNSIRYEFSKISDSFYRKSKDSMYNNFLKKIKNTSLNSHIQLMEYSSIEYDYFLILAGLYEHNKDKN